MIYNIRNAIYYRPKFLSRKKWGDRVLVRPLLPKKEEDFILKEGKFYSILPLGLDSHVLSFFKRHSWLQRQALKVVGSGQPCEL